MKNHPTQEGESKQQYSAKLVWFSDGPAWTCQLFERHVITIHPGDTQEARIAAEKRADDLNAFYRPEPSATTASPHDQAQ